MSSRIRGRPTLVNREGGAPFGGVSPNTYVILARAVRDFGDGFVAILLPV